MGTTKSTIVQIHGYADAAMRAFGCFIYVRVNDSSGISVLLLTAKSKVALTKTRTVPRLEFCAAHLLINLWNSVKSMLNFQPESVTLWSDFGL